MNLMGIEYGYQEPILVQVILGLWSKFCLGIFTGE